MQKSHLFVVALSLLLASCWQAGTRVYNQIDRQVGRIVVDDEDTAKATIYDWKSRKLGRVDGDRVYDALERPIGRVSEDDKIYNSANKLLGSVGEGTGCRNGSGELVGRISEDIDDEAAGGGCLLLLLR